MRIAIVITLILLAWVVLDVAFAKPEPISHLISEDDAVKAIIGEAENQGYTGMLAVACAIRNRGSLHGVYGLTAKRVLNKQYSHNTYHNALLAWHASATKDITDGATLWGNEEDVIKFGYRKWFNDYKFVYKYRDHSFFRKENQYD